MESIQIGILADLEERLRLRGNLRRQYQCVCSLATCPAQTTANFSDRRNSYLDVVSLFGPTILAIILNRCNQRDTQLAAEAEEAIIAQEDGNYEGGETQRGLKIHLELQTILCAEYRCAPR